VPVTRAHKWLNQDDRTVGVYNAWDTFATARTAAPIKEELRDVGNWEFFRRWFTRLGPVVADMARRGVGVLDTDARAAERRRVRAELRSVESLVRARMGNPDDYTDKFFGSTGPKGGQRARLLFDELQFQPAPRTRDRGERSTNQSALLYILKHLRKKDEANVPVIHDLFHRARLNTIDTRYLGVEADDDGRVRPTIKLAGAETLRLAYARPALQQWPGEIRHIIVAKPGHVFLAGDYKQLEGRISAHLSEDTVDLAVFAAGGDIHAQNARDLFGYSIDEWNALPDKQRFETRNWTKGWRYEIGYGGDPTNPKGKNYCPCPRCVELVPATLDLGRKAIAEAAARWERRHRPTVQFREGLVRHIAKNGYRYTSPWGYTRQFFRPLPDSRNEMYNFPIQHAAAQIINEAMIRLHEKWAAPMVLQMHDELVLEVAAGEVDAWTSLLVEEMEAPVPELGGASFPVDVHVAETWGGLK
jgi:DNA polymerase-1